MLGRLEQRRILHAQADVHAIHSLHRAVHRRGVGDRALRVLKLGAQPSPGARGVAHQQAHTMTGGANSWDRTPNKNAAVSFPRSGSSWTATRIVTSSLSDATIAAATIDCLFNHDQAPGGEAMRPSGFPKIGSAQRQIGPSSRCAHRTADIRWRHCN